MSARRTLATGIALVVVSSALSWWVGSNVQSPTEAAASATPPPPAPVTAPVERRVLEDRLVVRGTVEAAGEVPLAVDAPASDTGRTVVTKLPLGLGDRVTEGTLVLEISGRPVFAFQGSLPAYRDLAPGMRGEDVGQLQAALVRIGYPIWDRRQVFGAWTARAVRRLYRVRGYEAQERPAAAGPGPDSSGAAASPARRPPSASSPEPGRGRAADPRPVLVVPYAELAYLRRLPARVSAVQTAVGRSPDGRLLTLSAGAPVVEARLSAAEARLVKAGVPVTVAGDLGGLRLRGRVEAVTRLSAASTEAGGGGGTGPAGDAAMTDQPDADGGSEDFRVRIRTAKPMSLRLLGRDVQVTIAVASTRGKVLAVPVAAIWSGADGSARVTRVGQGGREEDVTVQPGLSAAGYVAVRAPPAELGPGDLVVVGR